MQSKHDGLKINDLRPNASGMYADDGVVSETPKWEPNLTEREFCAITGQSVGTARRYRMLGKGCRYVKLGRLVRYRPQDVRDYLQQNIRAVVTDDRS